MKNSLCGLDPVSTYVNSPRSDDPDCIVPQREDELF